GGAAHAGEAGQVAPVLVDLGGQLAGGRHHQGANGAARLRDQAVEDGQQERGGLPAAGHGAGEHVAAGQHRRDRVALDRGGGLEAQRGDAAEQVGMKSEVGERHGASDLVRAGNRARGQSSAVIWTRPTMRKWTGNAVCECRTARRLRTAYTLFPRTFRYFRGEIFPRGYFRAAASPRAGAAGLLGALGHPLRDLGLEEGERQRARRLVGVHVLALGLAAAHVEFAVAAQRLAPAQRDGDGLGDDVALKRLRGSSGHDVPFLPAVATEGSSIRYFSTVARSMASSFGSPITSSISFSVDPHSRRGSPAPNPSTRSR